MVDNINPASLIGANPLGGASKPASQAGGVSFMDMIKSGVEDVRKAQSESESLTQQALIGKADLNEVVQSVAKAEVMLQTMVSIRDRLLSAYQEIMNTRI